MEKIEEDKNESEFCSCEKSSGVYTETNDFARRDVCIDCDKPIEDSLVPLNHYDGEDHDLDITDLI